VSLREAQLDAAWEKLGFVILRKRADVKADLYVGERFVLRTFRSHGRGKLDGNIPYEIRKQMKLNEAEFKAAIDCPLNREGYLAILRRKGIL
jgi:hypothetical protein